MLLPLLCKSTLLWNSTWQHLEYFTAKRRDVLDVLGMHGFCGWSVMNDQFAEVAMAGRSLCSWNLRNLCYCWPGGHFCYWLLAERNPKRRPPCNHCIFLSHPPPSIPPALNNYPNCYSSIHTPINLGEMSDVGPKMQLMTALIGWNYWVWSVLSHVYKL